MKTPRAIRKERNKYEKAALRVGAKGRSTPENQQVPSPAEMREISDFLFALGDQFIKVRNAEGAFDCFKYSLDLNPQNQSAVHNLGVLYGLQGNMEGSLRMFAESYRMNPTQLNAQVAYADTLRKVGRFEESWKMLSLAKEQDPESLVVLSAESLLCYNTSRIDEAMVLNEKLLRARPDDKIAKLNQALMNMTYGDWPANWPAYEDCLSYGGNEKMRGLHKQKAWRGEDISGKTLLVISDQGAGDAIQFGRYVIDAKIKSNAAKVVFLCPVELVSLLSRYPGVDEAVGFGTIEKLDYDHFTSLLGVMNVLGISPEDCGRAPLKISLEGGSGPLPLDEDFQNPDRRPRIGLVWAGDPRHGNDAARSIPLSKFLPLITATNDHVDWFSFQVGDSRRQLYEQALPFSVLGIQDFGEEVRDFLDTAAGLAQIDVLITVDTSIAHLSGTLGVCDTIMLIPNPPEWRWGLAGEESEWRWGLEGEESVWYPQVRGGHFMIRRQRFPRVWDDVIAQLIDEIRGSFD